MPAPPHPGEPERVFVYGTLRRGGGRGDLLASARFLTVGRTPGSLYDLGEYPALVLDGAGLVWGEVWSCTRETLLRLDAYEAVEEGLFRRVSVRVADLVCWAYVAGPRLHPRIRPERRIPAGSWPPDPIDPPNP